MRIHIRLMLAALPCAALLGAAESAPAAEYPYCMSRVAGRFGMVEECNYVSMEQCQRSSIGLAGSCAPNWRLQYYHQREAVDAPPVRRRYKRRHFR